MNQNLQENMTTSSSECPRCVKTGQCKGCSKVISGFYLKSVLGLAEKLLPPNELCESCYAQKEHAEEVKREADRIKLAFSDSMMTPRFLEKRFDNFQVSERNRKAYEAAVNFDPSNSEGQGILFYGTFGIGKTHLAAAIANRHMGKTPLLYISCPDLLAEVRDAMNTKGAPNRLAIAKGVRLLILDDIGAEKPSEWVRETLFLLVNHRYEHKLPTIMTTNCAMDELDTKLGGRIVSRISEVSTCIKYEDIDRRLKISKPRAVGS